MTAKKKKRKPYKKQLPSSGPVAKARTNVRRKMIADILERTRKSRIELDQIIRTGKTTRRASAP